jgi:hypothetical protein
LKRLVPRAVPGDITVTLRPRLIRLTW